jgi:multidrug transporter EmrE-like cation transporter
MVLTFVLNNCKFSIGPMLWRIDHWFWSIILATILVAFGQPAGICVSAAFCVFVLVALTASTIQSLMKADIRLGTALGIWGGGTCLAILGWYLFRDELGTVGMLLLAALAGLSMLPFFSTTESIRRAHTS